MRAAWQEWIAENPFLMRDVRRWRRRNTIWRMAIAGAAFPAVLILALHAILHFGGPLARQVLDRPFGLILFCVLAIVHFFTALAYSGSGISLPQEAVADRLDFVRLLPMDRREFIAKLGIARLLLRTAPLLMPLPLYVLLLAYGGVPVEDVLALYAFLALILFLPPGLAEIVAALTSRRGTTAVTHRQGAQSGVGWLWWIGFQAFFQLGLRPLFRGASTVLAGRLGPLFQGPLANAMPLSLIVVFLRLLWLPGPFYAWYVPPLLALGIYWTLVYAWRIFAAAEMWTREAADVPVAFGRTTPSLPEETGRPDEQRRVGSAALGMGLLLAIGLVGFLWRPMVLSGSMGHMAGSSTPSGGLAAILILFGALISLRHLEVLRSREGQKITRWSERLRSVVKHAGWCLGQAMVITAGAALLGGVLPWPEPFPAVGMLAVVLFVELLFASAWGAWMSRYHGMTTPDPKSGSSGREVGIILLWLASYLVPILVMLIDRVPAPAHYLAAASPIYALLALLPGLWKSEPLPLAVALLPALAATALMLALAPRELVSQAPAEPAPEREREDPLERRFRRLAAVWENPLFLLSLHRMARQPSGLSNRCVGGIVVALLLTGVIAVAIGGAAGARSGVPYWQIPWMPLGPRSTVTIGTLVGLLAGGLLIWVCPQIAAGALVEAVRTEAVNGRKQQRLFYVLISGIEDRQIVEGVVAGAAVSHLPTVLAGTLVGTFWLLFAFACGAPWWWAVVALGVWLITLAGGLHSALHTFERWPKRNLRYWLIQVLRVVVIPIGVVVALSVLGFRRLGLSFQPVVDFLVFVLPVLPYVPLVVGLITLAALPRTYRAALKAIYDCRHEDDLERVA